MKHTIIRQLLAGLGKPCWQPQCDGLAGNPSATALLATPSATANATATAGGAAAAGSDADAGG